MSTRKKVPKKSRQSSTTLKQYYADDMNDEEIDYPKTGKIQKTVKATQDYDDDDDDLPSDNDYVNIEEPSTQDTIKKQSMDKISDILFSLILKNRVNSKNAFDIPLPDVEQLSDFRIGAGDSSWKKLSQALDVASKIYGFRVDSLFHEALKVLGGLHRTELNNVFPGEVRNDDDEDEIQGAGKEEQSQKKHRRETGGEITLEKNLNNIDVSKYDLEFELDPLFQRTSAKFDEGGAKGLLLNNLNIDYQLNLMFDSGYIVKDSSEDFPLFDTQTQNQKKSNLKNKLLSDLGDMLDDLYTLKLCPELLLFKQNFLKDFKENKNDEDFFPDNSPFQSIQADSEVFVSLKFEDVQVNADKILNDIGKIFDDEFYNPQILTKHSQIILQEDQFQLTNDNSNNISQDHHHPLSLSKKELELNFDTIEERLAFLGFGKPLETLLSDNKNWMGPQTWKITKKRIINAKVKKPQDSAAAVAKKQKQFHIDFDMSIKETIYEAFSLMPISRNRGTSFEPEIIRSHNLLPIDMQIKPSRLNNLFQRGLNYKKDHDLNSIKNEDNWSSWSRDLDEKQTELIDPNVQNEIQQDLGLIFGTLNQNGLQVDKPERFVNIKALKEQMWSYLEPKIPSIPPNEITETSRRQTQLSKKKYKTKNSKQALSFINVVADLPNFVSKQRKSPISVHSCFVTILHLANEKNLTFFSENNQDFGIYRETY